MWQSTRVDTLRCSVSVPYTKFVSTHAHLDGSTQKKQVRVTRGPASPHLRAFIYPVFSPRNHKMDSGIARITKQFEALNARNTKLQEENAKLKQQLAEHKSLNSRIRRVPQKKEKADKAAAAGGEPTAQPAPEVAAT